MILFNDLKIKLKGELFTDETHKLIYATDASAYREIPTAVVYPKDETDIKTLIDFANQYKIPLIPRGGGTSLAGQVVGKGIVVDVSRYMNKILEINEKEKWARVQPGVVLWNLNEKLKKYGLQFGPETSSASRCTIGGMVGNNATGLHSLWYGSTREHILEITAFLSDGSKVIFNDLSKDEFYEKCKLENLEGEIYRNINLILSNPINQNLIKENYPDPKLTRRNTGYALDLLLDTSPFSDNAKPFNFSKLLAGSEGTLAFITEIKLNLVPLPPKHKALLCVHFQELKEAFYGNLVALKYNPSAVELMDKTILDLTKENIEQQKNRFFVKGEPGAILIIELNADEKTEIEQKAKAIEEDMRKQKLGYYFPLIWGDDTKKVWELRRSGLGVLSNMKGDAKPVSVIEDTAVLPEKLPAYLEEFAQILKKYGLSAVYHAHIGSGELHLRPILNLKNEKDRKLFRTIATEIAYLVKKYKGSLSGEHGDGRLRGEFIPIVLGNEVYKLLKQVKYTWDKNNIFNPGKIVDTPPMDENLRYLPAKLEFKTYFDFSKDGSYLQSIEKCNGSADCRKSPKKGGVMCPSYQATQNEFNATRARANLLREFFIKAKKIEDFTHEEVYQILDLCLSCKGCKAECPSNVDMTKLKAEFLQHYYDNHSIPLRTRIIANFPKINKLLSLIPAVSNFLMNSIFSKLIMKILGFAPEREFPEVNKPLKKWYKKYQSENQKVVYLFNDEFTNINDTDIGIKTILLLENLGYKVIIPKTLESGRTYLSKGLVKKAKKVINQNLLILKDLITEENPLIGIEPSAILTFRDEALDLADPELKPIAEKLAKNTLLYDEFIIREYKKGNIKPEQFTTEPLKIKVHGHCYQKALASVKKTIEMLSIPANYNVEEIPSGCCGMAGSFGYEKEHYELSMKIGNMILFPTIRQSSEDTVIAAPGTSCRHHIKHGTGRTAKHPVEILYEALLK